MTRALKTLLLVVALVLAPGAAEAARTATPATRTAGGQRPARTARPPRAARAARAARSRALRPVTGKKVVVFVGLPGSGKSTAADRLAARLGVTRLSTGDAIRNTIKARGLPYNEINDRAVAEEFARNPGEIARRTIATVRADPSPVSVVEGFRTMADVTTFRKAFPDAIIVSVEVGRERRFARMLERGRTGEDNRAYLLDRDRSEVRRGVRNVMRAATVRIRPRGDDGFDSLDRSVDRLLRIVNGTGK